MKKSLSFGLCVIVGLLASTEIGTAQQSKVPEKAWEKARKEGFVRVLVTLSVKEIPEGRLNREARDAQRRAIAAGQNALLAELKGTQHRVVGKGRTGNFIILEVNVDALSLLDRSSLAKKVEVDRFEKFSLAESVPIVRAPQAWNVGYDGSGWAIGIIDSGVQSDHPFLENKVIVEACFSVKSSCPQGGTEEYGSGSAVPCSYATDCKHGTHVAGIAVGLGESFSGVAKGAAIIAIQISSRGTGEEECGPPPNEDPCSIPSVADQVQALDYMNLLADYYDVAAVNMSVGVGKYPHQRDCDEAESSRKQRIDALRTKKVATILPSGNEEYTDGINTPACISTAVSVGATWTIDNEEEIALFSNSAPFLSLVAPGFDINSSVPGGTFEEDIGTSFAAPHVAGAWAILKEKEPNATVGQILNALQTTGKKITDTRQGANNRVNCLIQIDQALPHLPQDLIASTPFQASANGINNCGQIVGIDWDTYMGFIWDTSGLYNAITYDENQVEEGGWLDYVEATGINNKGEVTGYYCCGYWGDRGFGET